MSDEHKHAYEAVKNGDDDACRIVRNVDGRVIVGPVGWKYDLLTARVYDDCDDPIDGMLLSSALIVEMLDKLPDGWKVHRYFSMFAADRFWVVKQPDGVESVNPDLSLSLYSALVAAGVVTEKEKTNERE